MKTTRNTLYREDYEQAFGAIYPNLNVEVRGPGKKGIHRVYINGDDGGLKLSEQDIIEATANLTNKGEPSLSAHMQGSRVKLEHVARMA